MKAREGEIIAKAFQRGARQACVRCGILRPLPDGFDCQSDVCPREFAVVKNGLELAWLMRKVERTPA